jgi:hypothetical protein
MRKATLDADQSVADLNAPRDTSLLSWTQRIGYMVLALQFAAFIAWSATLYNRFAVTIDYAVYHQPWYLIAHGHLDPYSTVAGMPFWRNDSEFMPWILAPLYWIWPHGLLLMWLQGLSIVGAEAVVFTWICQMTRRRCPDRSASWIAALGLLLLVADPWILWTVSFDVHEEPLVIIFVALLAWDLAEGRRRVWLWILPVMAGGAPSAIYAVGLGIGGMLGGRRTRLTGALIASAGIGYSFLVIMVHGDAGFPLTSHYGYLAAGSVQMGSNAAQITLLGLLIGVCKHPLLLLRILWSKRTDMLANVAPSGLLGIGTATLLPLAAIVLIADTLIPGVQYAAPSFQSLPIYVMLPAGTASVLVWLSRRRRRLAVVAGVLISAQALGWATVWGSRTATQWLRISPPASATLAAISTQIPRSAEVIASQGIMGRFSARASIFPLMGTPLFPVGRRQVLPIERREVWFVIAPMTGIEIESTGSAMALLAEAAGPLHARIVVHAHGVWALRWHPRPGIHMVTVPPNDSSSPLPAWTSPGNAGRAVMSGPAPSWHVVSTGAKGYVADGLAWQLQPARYKASVRLSADGPVNVELWNDTGNVLLARRSLPRTAGLQSISLPVVGTRDYHSAIFMGWGLFRARFHAPPAGERIEVRVWSAGHHTVAVYEARIVRAS